MIKVLNKKFLDPIWLHFTLGFMVWTGAYCNAMAFKGMFLVCMIMTIDMNSIGPDKATFCV